MSLARMFSTFLKRNKPSFLEIVQVFITMFSKSSAADVLYVGIPSKQKVFVVDKTLLLLVLSFIIVTVVLWQSLYDLNINLPALMSCVTGYSLTYLSRLLQWTCFCVCIYTNDNLFNANFFTQC